MLYVPEGFAHGFWAIQDSIFHYKCTTEYHSESDGGINPLDDRLDLPWMESKKYLIISEKDRSLPYLRDFRTPFV